MKKCVLFAIMLALFVNNVYGGSLRTIANPDPRSYSCMITDSINARAILFGGGDYRLPWGQCFNDVWFLDFNSEAWKLIAPLYPSPLPRVMASVAYDPAGNRMILFGGGVVGYNPYRNDVWSLELSMGSEEWTEITPSGTPPTPRGSATAIIDPINNRLIIFGGEDGSAAYNETRSLDLNTLTWAILSPSGTTPAARFAHSAVYDPNAHRMIIFGGANYGQPMMNDVWSLDLTYGSEHWQQLYPSGGPPAQRCRQFCAFNNLNNSLVIGFGYDCPGYMIYYNDVRKLDLNSLTWMQILPSGIIEGRRGSCAAYDPINEQVLIFGGDQDFNYYFGSTYALTLDTLAVKENQESRVSISPYIKISSNPAQLPCKMNIFVPFSGDICLKVFDVSGRLVNTLIKDQRNSGNYMINWDGKDNKGKKVAAGTYFINLEIDGISEVEKVVLIE